VHFLDHNQRQEKMSTYGSSTGGKRKVSQDEVLERREKGFALTGLQSVKLREYNALYDPNMRHFFESRNNQYFLYRTGQIDSNGRVIDLDKNKSKLFILEREFKEAEKIEERRQQEEMEMRVSLTVSIDLDPHCSR
jgi:hypothetical protein